MAWGLAAAAPGLGLLLLVSLRLLSFELLLPSFGRRSFSRPGSRGLRVAGRLGLLATGDDRSPGHPLGDVGGQEIMSNNGLPHAIRHAVGIDCFFRVFVGQGVSFDVEVGEEEAVASKRAFFKGRHPNDTFRGVSSRTPCMKRCTLASGLLSAHATAGPAWTALTHGSQSTK